MGAQIDRTATGVEIEIHVFDTRALAEQYVKVGRRYSFDKHEDWALCLGGFDFYNGPVEGERATIRCKDGKAWHAVFWINSDTRVVGAGAFESKPAWNGEYRIGGTWFPVTNSDGHAICYASTDAALAGAKFSLGEVHRNTVR